MSERVRANLDYNIVLIGFMGAGKSTVSAYLEREYGMKIAEMDQLIAEREGKSITEIFECSGESYFRDCETRLLRELQQKQNVVISCGGGIVMCDENIPIMRENGRVVLLTATPETVYERVKDSEERPILNGKKTVAYISELMEKRREKYESVADIIIQTDGKNVQEICEELMRQLKK